MNTMAVLVHLVAGLQRNPAGLRELRWICIAAAAFLHDMSAAAFSRPVQSGPGYWWCWSWFVLTSS